MIDIEEYKSIYKGEEIKIGLLGGTFDPPHFAHIYMAREARKALGLDRVVFMPCGTPPHKNGKYISSSYDRISMLKILLEDESDFYIDGYETKISSKSYTIESIKRIKKLMDKSAKLYFIIGADSLMYLDKWYKSNKLMKIASFVVIPRYGLSKGECLVKIKYLENDFNADITYVDCEAMNISSTDIRHEIINNNSYAKADEKLQKYIKKNKLYE